MPIFINLLAEQQAAEDLRRRDPVKRAVWIGGFVVALVAVWVGFLQVKIFAANSALASVESKWKAMEQSTEQVAKNLKKTAEIERKLAALQTLAKSRFLWANTLNALQSTIVDNVHVVRLRSEQSYSLAPTKTGADAKNAKPAGARERILFTIEAKDFANPAELNHNRFISEISGAKTFAEQLPKTGGVRLKDRLPPQPDPADPSRNFILFSIECRYPEKERIL